MEGFTLNAEMNNVETAWENPADTDLTNARYFEIRWLRAQGFRMEPILDGFGNTIGYRFSSTGGNTMITRGELDELYKKMWQRGPDGGGLEYFRIFLEYFIPFPQWGFSFVKKEVGGNRSLEYHSLHVKLRISPDFEMYRGIGWIDFFYSRLETPDYSRDAPEQWCWPWINTRKEYLHYFLAKVPANETKTASMPPVKQAFEKMRASDEFLKKLWKNEPAYVAAFEAFSWKYYGERLFRLFYPENQAERDALAEYIHEYCKANYPPELVRKWEERRYSPPPEREEFPPPWKICV